LMALYSRSTKIIDEALPVLEASRSSVLFEKLCENIGSFRIVALLIISRIIIRLNEIKRSKMIKRFKFYHCNKVLESAVDLKNRPQLWEKVADVQVSQGSGEIDVQLPLPVVTCNVVLEMAEFHEIATASTSDAPELVHCPRCSTAVPPNPGICSNCGENVFQCIKCRAINYDEKEPFLCNSCGFCKYARLEAVIVGRSTPSVQTIEDDRERGTGPVMTTLYRNAEKLHAKLCEKLRQLAAFRAELYRYDVENGDTQMRDIASYSNGFYTTSDRCVGCVSSLIVHCIGLIRAVCHDSNAMEEIISGDFVFDRLGPVMTTLYRNAEKLHAKLCEKLRQLAAFRAELYRYDVENGDTQMRDIASYSNGFYTTSYVTGCALGDAIAKAIHTLIWTIAECSDKATKKMCALVENGMLPCYLLTKFVGENNLKHWEEKLRCLARMTAVKNGDTEVDLHLLSLLCKICARESSPSKKDETEKPAATHPSTSKRKSGAEVVAAERPASSDHQQPELVAVPEVADEDEEEEHADPEQELQDVKVDESSLRVILENLETLDETEPDFDKLVVPSDGFSTTEWLKGRFIWSEYGRLLTVSEPERERCIFQYLKRCSEVGSKQKFVSFFNYYLQMTLEMMNISPLFLLESFRSFIIALFLPLSGSYNLWERICSALNQLEFVSLLSWLQQSSNYPADQTSEYFSLLQALVKVPKIRSLLLSKPISFHVDISSLKLRAHEVNDALCDLSVGTRLYHLILVLKCIMQKNKLGWKQLSESSALLFPLLLRASCALKGIVVLRTL
uniref:Protein purity of essence n=1 Tax=Gongylonema pulchrum TaxID=637853 RepID=A0A183DUK4_9BILA